MYFFCIFAPGYNTTHYNPINMKHRSLLLALALLSAQLIMAITYCASSAIGYGAAATGGGNATPTLVKSVSELTTALKASGNKVIIITQNITFTSMQKVKATNKTLMALPGVKLISLKQDATNSGILYFSSGSSNIILRNITFEGPGAYDCDGNDLLCFDGVTKAWVDHCDFQDGCDGNFDNKGNTDNVTVTWCRFRYLKAPKAGGPGGSDDHRYTNLLGSSSSDKPSDGTYNMTWAYCWWDNGCKERMLRCRNASLHFLNCYWNSNVANYYVGPENADCRFDGCSMQGNPAKAKYFYQNYGGKNGAIFTNCIAKNGVPSNVTNRTVATIPYTYTTETAANAVTAITSACGAGATLNVTTGGIVSSTCDGGGTQVNTYTVTFNANGHGTAPAKQTINENELVQQPAAPIASGYTFGGWYREAACTTAWNFASDRVTGNLTLYAKWTAAIAPNPGGGEGSSEEVCYSLLSTPTIPNGMVITVNGSTPSYDAANGISLTANNDYFCIDVSGLGKTIIEARVTIKTGSKDAAKGFYYGTSCEEGFNGTSILNTEKTFTEYTLSGLNTQVLSLRRLGTSTYVNHICLTLASGGSQTTTCTDPSLSYAEDEVNKTMGDAAFTHPLTNTDGLTITYTSSNKQVATVSSSGKVTLVGAGVVTITAHAAEQTKNNRLYCEKEVSYTLDVAPQTIYYTLSFDANGGSGSIAPAQYEEGDEVIVPGNSFTAPDGKLFNVWNTAATGTGTDYEPGDMLKMLQDVTLYAQWKERVISTGECSASIFYCGSAEAEENSQSPYITGITTGTKSTSGSITIDDITYTATHATQISTSAAVGIQVPAQYEATLYIAAASSSSSSRQLKLFDANTNEVATAETAASSSQAKQIVFPNLAAGQYTLKTVGGGANLCILGLELCPLGATTEAEETSNKEQATKYILNGQIVIERNGKVYDLTGRLVH